MLRYELPKQHRVSRVLLGLQISLASLPFFPILPFLGWLFPVLECVPKKTCVRNDPHATVSVFSSFFLLLCFGCWGWHLGLVHARQALHPELHPSPPVQWL